MATNNILRVTISCFVLFVVATFGLCRVFGQGQTGYTPPGVGCVGFVGIQCFEGESCFAKDAIHCNGRGVERTMSYIGIEATSFRGYSNVYWEELLCQKSYECHFDVEQNGCVFDYLTPQSIYKRWHSISRGHTVAC